MTHDFNLSCAVLLQSTLEYLPKSALSLKRRNKRWSWNPPPLLFIFLPIKLLKIIILKFETPRLCAHSEAEVYVKLATHTHFHSMILNFSCARKSSRLLFTDCINIDSNFHLRIFWVRKRKRSWKISLYEHCVEDTDAQFGEPVIKHGLWCDLQLSPVSVWFWVWVKSWSFTCMDLSTNSKEWE